MSNSTVATPRNVNNNQPTTMLDMLLKSLLLNPKFLEREDKNWPAVAKRFSGISATQCARRFQELQKEQLNLTPSVEKIAKRLNESRGPDLEARLKSPSEDQHPSGPSSSKQKEGSRPSSKGSVEDSHKQSDSNYYDQSPVMVIHVCDEAKNLKQDFHCQRDVLIKEMKYFAEYLSNDSQRWEEVDISVHCDVQIFDWLMKYVKRHEKKDGTQSSKLEAGNVISILISSDFLKMDRLVEECIVFCHENMSAIVATPCNMNCINDKLVTRIAALFTHNEADDVKDRKDKFKSKLFMKKIEKLFDENATVSDSTDKATSLYKCSLCKKLLTKSMQSKVQCSQSRMTIDRLGQLKYSHIPDASWDVNDFLIDLKNQLKSWRDVYWRLWGTINCLTCIRCKETFPCSELGHCRYHSEPAKYDNNLGKGALGEHSCCGQKTMRFDPTQINKGCKVRDHVISVNTESEEENPVKIPSIQNQVYEDLLRHRETICVPYQKFTLMSNSELDVFADEEIAHGLRKSESFTKKSDTSVDESLSQQPKLEPLIKQHILPHGAVAEQCKAPEVTPRASPRSRTISVVIEPKAILVEPPTFGGNKADRWDITRSIRWNQDSQREEGMYQCDMRGS
ncbi:unnamed protein product [Owenia fusiformis]|uniref:SANT and BTB domain-containing protein n=1 Tax=Owenia fusiformis TaxID=6347 RepID=A0A8S4Q669_OWEFU|nr:unnamed protein product [Owenia fusiformis]